MNKITIGNMPRPDYFVQSEIDRLRVNVGFAGTDKKVILVTSSEPNEGKSYISVNLWNELAKAGKSVCFVDADMRKSVLRNTLRISSDREDFAGLSHYLAGYVDAESIIYATDRQRAYMIPTATLVNPSLLLEGKRFDNLILSLRQSFDYVIVDTPPLGLVSDGQKIAAKCDGCILVVRAHETRKEVVRSSIQQLETVDCPLLGIVLNRAESRRARGYYSKGYYSKYYGKYYYSNASGLDGSSGGAKKSADAASDPKPGGAEPEQKS